jgi:probable biosynthetic protein (TIGR04099 family)
MNIMAPTIDALPTAHCCVGMPQLCATGLSENWLLKECGDRHWEAISQSTGQGSAALRDVLGRRLYSAFTSVHVRDATLQAVQENDQLRLDTRWCAASRSQRYSQHEVCGADGSVAQVEMLSVFVSRERSGDNRSVVRSGLAGERAPPLALSASLAAAAQACAESARAVRTGAWTERFGIQAAARPGLPGGHADKADVLERFDFMPCPNGDFNGAGLLYFASYQAIADRALWHWGMLCGRQTTRERQIVYYGNANVGELLSVQLLAHSRTLHGSWQWSRVIRASNQQVLADIATHKA